MGFMRLCSLTVLDFKLSKCQTVNLALYAQDILTCNFIVFVFPFTFFGFLYFLCQVLEQMG